MNRVTTGRFAPSPSGRMHLGNIYTAVVSRLMARRDGGRWILRIEDIDPGRSRACFATAIEDDLRWLGLDWDEGGTEGKGPAGPYVQSLRDRFYREAVDRLAGQGLLYRCHCTRADIMATQAPHESDGRIVYHGRCRPSALPPFTLDREGHGSVRLWVPDEDIEFVDHICGAQKVNLARHCGDFVVKRSDGAWAYQLAVVVDDALMGVNQVVRGEDLLLSTAQQLYLYRLLGYEPPRFYHLPLVRNGEGVRLSKRDKSLSMEHLRAENTPEEVLGMVARMLGLGDRPMPLSELQRRFDVSGMFS